jgi:hypothetical protein
MADELQPPEQPQPISRRRFVASGAAIGAAVVWGAPFPFADAAIGQVIHGRAGLDATGTTGPTGPTGSTGTGSTGTTGSTGKTGPTSTSGPSGPTGPTGKHKPSKTHRIKIELHGGSITEDDHGHIPVTLENIGTGACTGTVKLEAMVGKHGHRHRVSLGSAHFNIPAKRKHRLQIKLDRAGRTQLSEHHSVPIRLVVTVHDGRNQQRMVKLHPEQQR